MATAGSGTSSNMEEDERGMDMAEVKMEISERENGSFPRNNFEFSSYGGSGMSTRGFPLMDDSEQLEPLGLGTYELDHAMQEMQGLAEPSDEDMLHLPMGAEMGAHMGFIWDDVPASAPVSAPGSYISSMSLESSVAALDVPSSDVPRFAGMLSMGVMGRSSDSESSSGSAGAPPGNPVKVKKKIRRSSAPDLALAGPSNTTNFKKEYHNRAERDRTRRINACIQELRVIVGCADSDKVSILQMCVDAVAAHKRSGLPSPGRTSSGEASPALPPPAPAAAAAAAAGGGGGGEGSSSGIELTPLLDGMQMALGVVGLDMRCGSYSSPPLLSPSWMASG